MGNVVGVTGGIAGGKSLFVSYLAEMGAETISADAIARDLLEVGTAHYYKIVDSFGCDILLPGGEIDRTVLAEKIFSSQEARETLNGIIHPQVIEEVQRRIELFREEHSDDCVCLVVEVPLLFECNMQGLFDITVVVAVEQATQICRLTKCRGMTYDQAMERIVSQLSDSAKCEMADIVIPNNGSADDLRARAREIFKSICFPLA